MKKILLAIAAVATMTGCTQNEEFDNLGQKAEIGFNTAAVTRATAMTTANFNEFKVYGYAHTGTFGAEITVTAFVDGAFTKKENNKWTEDQNKKFYWPTEGNVTFFAYSPAGETGTTYAASAKGYPTVDYKVNDVITSQSDFVVAQKTGDGVTDKDGVSLGFKHALTQIVFKLKGSDKDVNYSVTKLDMKGIMNSGTYNWADNTWTVGTVPANYTINMAGGAATEFLGDAADVTELSGNDKVLMLIPQAPAAATIDVTYSAMKGEVEICKGTKTVNVPKDQWGVGQKIIFTIALTPGNEITITGNLDDNDWTDKDPQPGDLK